MIYEQTPLLQPSNIDGNKTGKSGVYPASNSSFQKCSENVTRMFS